MTRRNNFDALRLLLASTVFVWHAYDLSRHDALSGIAGWFNADLAVKAFFVVSGYLVVMSYEKSSSFGNYVDKRLRRIYPAYATVILFCAVGGMFVTTLPLKDYVSGPLFTYLTANLVFLNFLHPTLPGVFAGNPWTEVNGALWTLKIEVMFYAIVPAVVAAKRRLGIPIAGVTLFAASIAWRLGMELLADATGRALYSKLAYQLPGQLTYFLVGAVFYWCRNHVASVLPALGILAVVAYLGANFTAVPGVHTVLEPVWLGVAVVVFATIVPYLGNFARFGDMSYGLYIVHFPIIQCAVAAGWFDRAPLVAATGCFIAALIAALVSWHLVEAPFLRRGSHYRGGLTDDRGKAA